MSNTSGFFSGIIDYVPVEKVKKGRGNMSTKVKGAYDKTMVDEDVNLDPQDIPCAYISDRVYLDPFSRPRHIFGFTLDEKYNEFEFALYVNAEKKIRILGYRGTEVTEVKDYVSDLHIVFGTQSWNDRFNSSVKVYEDAKKAYPDYQGRVTGHSLGGTIAYFITKKFQPDRCVVFNPGSSANPTFVSLITESKMQAGWTRRVFTYRIAGDAISTLSVIGHTRTFRKRNFNPVGLHAISNFCTIENVTKDVF